MTTLLMVKATITVLIPYTNVYTACGISLLYLRVLVAITSKHPAMLANPKIYIINALFAVFKVIILVDYLSDDIMGIDLLIVQGKIEGYLYCGKLNHIFRQVTVCQYLICFVY